MVPIKQKTKEIIKKLPEQKPHLDFLAALLTIPVLITVLLLNFNNLNLKKTASTTPTPTQTQADKQKTLSPTPKRPSTNVTSVESAVSAIPTPQGACTPDIGPIDISFPQENQTVSDNPVCIDISYHGQGYCAVVWAYKVNNGSLSDYANNTACLYNLPNGQNTFTLQVKSLVSNNTQTLERHFLYKGTNPNFTPTPQATSSAQ